MAVLSSAPLQFVASIPPVTRAFTAATVVGSLIYYWLWWFSGPEFSVPYLVLVPGSSLLHPWTLFTSAFVETSVFEVSRPVILRSFTCSDSVLAVLYLTRDTSISAIFGAAMGCC